MNDSHFCQRKFLEANSELSTTIAVLSTIRYNVASAILLSQYLSQKLVLAEAYIASTCGPLSNRYQFIMSSSQLTESV